LLPACASGIVPWWQAARACPELVEFCQANAGICVYGEVYGQVQDLRYGTGKDEIRFAAFDLLDSGQWLPYASARALARGVPWVPELYRGPYAEGLARELADGPSTIPGADHIREGCVVRPLIERTEPEIGRVQLKVVSNLYLERAA
jgi:RNA ligase (TIGR02306 family)